MERLLIDVANAKNYQLNTNATTVIISGHKMGMSAVKYKIMPESPDINLEEIKNKAKLIIENLGGVFSSAEEIPIAFGLKSVEISFAFPEEKEIDEVGNELEKIENTSSVEMIDYRRAFG